MLSEYLGPYIAILDVYYCLIYSVYFTEKIGGDGQPKLDDASVFKKRME